MDFSGARGIRTPNVYPMGLDLQSSTTPPIVAVTPIWLWWRDSNPHTPKGLGLQPSELPIAQHHNVFVPSVGIEPTSPD